MNVIKFKPRAWENSHVPFVTVLDRFDAQEHGRTNHRDQNVHATVFVAAQLSRTNRQSHCQAAEQQHNRVQTTQVLVQEHMGLVKNFRVMISVQRVCHEQTTEEQHFGDQEEPNAQLARIKLLLSTIEVMSDEFTMVVVVVVCCVCHFRFQCYPASNAFLKSVVAGSYLNLLVV